MALSTYADLLTTIQDYEDDTSTVVTSHLADFIVMAEQRIFQGYGRMGDAFYSAPLRVRSMEKSVTLPIGSGLDGGTSAGTANAQTVTLAAVPTLSLGLAITFTAGFSNTTAMTLNASATGVVSVRKGANLDELDAGDILAGGIYTVYHNGTYYVLMASDGAIPLPSRFLGIRSAYLQDRGNILFPMPVSGLNSFIEDETSGTPLYYAIEGDCLRFDPAPDQNYKLKLNYYARPASLSTALNDIFRNAPSIYLYATLMELALYLPNEDKMQAYHSQFVAACHGYGNSDKISVMGHAPMRVRFALAP
jgi:hypothetical protein